MQITKGMGSVVNGFESISGQINVELKKPINDAPIFINVFSSNMGRKEMNLHLNKKLNEKFSTGLFLHADKNSTIHDNNSDGFLDHPKYKGFNFFNRWQYTDLEKGVVGFLGFRFMKNEKDSGEDVDNMNLADRANLHFKIGQFIDVSFHNFEQSFQQITSGAHTPLCRHRCISATNHV